MKLAVVLVLAVVAAQALAVAGESKFCQQKKKECEKQCGGNSKMRFDCRDEDGARSVACSCVSGGGDAAASSKSSSKATSTSSAKAAVGEPLFANLDPLKWGEKEEPYGHHDSRDYEKAFGHT